MYFKLLSTSLFIISFGLFNYVSADEIYRWVSPDGVVNYSTKKSEPKAKLADLPVINKGDFKVGAVTALTCDKHGGINCQAGPDVDGSVICFDGYDGASARFSFHCSSPKLRISDISDPDHKGMFTVYIRNDRSVPANAPRITYTSPEGAKLVLKGPSDIPPFQMAEYTLYSAALAKMGEKPTESQFDITCLNCNG